MGDPRERGRRPIRIANCSGFLGDRAQAAVEMIEGGPIDVLTGDYLAELTMLILHKTRARGRPGYASPFLGQLERVLGPALDAGIRIVTNAGGLEPERMAAEVEALAAELGAAPVVAYVTGDDVTDQLDGWLAAGRARALHGSAPVPHPLAPQVANAYLGGWGIAAALSGGADIVICPRVSDASLVTGPAGWWFDWSADDWDALAGAVVAGHLIECGAQVTGGNFAFFEEVPHLTHPGFPIAEVGADGSAVITKHPGTGGAVTVETVTAQLLYEVGSRRYANPDVVVRLDTVGLVQVGPDRVEVTGARGEPAPAELKVVAACGLRFRNTATLVLTGLALREKARLAEDALRAAFPLADDEELDAELVGLGDASAQDANRGTALLRLTLRSPDRERCGRPFGRALVEQALASYPGLFRLDRPGDAVSYAQTVPLLVDRHLIDERVKLGAGAAEPVRPRRAALLHEHVPEALDAPGPPELADGPGQLAPLGTVLGARSGDKGGDANLGVWVRDPGAFPWLVSFLHVEELRRLLPELRPHQIERHTFPNIHGLNFVIRGLLGDGASAASRWDAQAKALGEQLRAVNVEIPEGILRLSSRRYEQQLA